jgi:hypothetical protein
MAAGRIGEESKKILIPLDCSQVGQQEFLKGRQSDSLEHIFHFQYPRAIGEIELQIHQHAYSF